MATDGFSYHIDGLDDINTQLDMLALASQKRVLGTAIKEAMKPILDYVKSHMLVDTGQLKKSIKIYPGKRTKGQLWFNVGPNIYSAKKAREKAKANGKVFTRKEAIRLDPGALLKWV